MDLWFRIITARMVEVLSRLGSEEKQLEMLQNLIFFINKLSREIKLNGRLSGPDKRIKGD